MGNELDTNMKPFLRNTPLKTVRRHDANLVVTWFSMMSAERLHLSKQFEMIHTDTRPGGRLNKKDGLTRHGNSHVKDKTS